MNSDKQLNKFTNQWFLMLLITGAVASAFFWFNDIIVKNIGDIEFSGTLENFNANIAGNLEAIKANTYYDFLFIVVYTILFYIAYRVFQSSMRIPASKILILCCIIPGVFDIIENVLLLNLLTNSNSTWLFNSFWLVVRIKWTFIIPLALVNITILMYYILRFVNSFFS